MFPELIWNKIKIFSNIIFFLISENFRSFSGSIIVGTNFKISTLFLKFIYLFIKSFFEKLQLTITLLEFFTKSSCKALFLSTINLPKKFG